MKGTVASTSGNTIPEWAARNGVWGRGKGPVPGCPVAWEQNEVPDDTPEPPEPFTRVPEPDPARGAVVHQIAYDV